MIAKVKICFLVVSSCFGASCGHGTPLATVSAATYVPLAVQTPGAEKSGTDARSVGDACDEAVICRGDFRVESDTELTALDRCRSISGDLVVQNQVWITNLELPCLSSVDGEVRIQNNPNLRRLGIFETLTSTGGLNVTGNPLRNVESFFGIQTDDQEGEPVDFDVVSARQTGSRTYEVVVRSTRPHYRNRSLSALFLRRSLATCDLDREVCTFEYLTNHGRAPGHWMITNNETPDIRPRSTGRPLYILGEEEREHLRVYALQGQAPTNFTLGAWVRAGTRNQFAFYIHAQRHTSHESRLIEGGVFEFQEKLVAWVHHDETFFAMKAFQRSDLSSSVRAVNVRALPTLHEEACNFTMCDLMLGPLVREDGSLHIGLTSTFEGVLGIRPGARTGHIISHCSREGSDSLQWVRPWALEGGCVQPLRILE